MGLSELSHPSRVLTVTGKCTAFTTAEVSRSILGMSFKMAEPAPLFTTFFTGQPQLMSMKSGAASSAIRAAVTSDCSS